MTRPIWSSEVPSLSSRYSIFVAHFRNSDYTMYSRYLKIVIVLDIVIFRKK